MECCLPHYLVCLLGFVCSFVCTVNEVDQLANRDTKAVDLGHNQQRLTAISSLQRGKEIEGRRQMLMMGSTGHVTGGAMSRENNNANITKCPLL